MKMHLQVDVMNNTDGGRLGTMRKQGQNRGQALNIKFVGSRGIGIRPALRERVET